MLPRSRRKQKRKETGYHMSIRPAHDSRSRNVPATLVLQAFRQRCKVLVYRLQPQHEEAPMHPRPVVHFEIHGKDGKALQDFYKEMFEWTMQTGPAANYALVEPGIGGPEAGVGGGIAQSPIAPAVTIYVQVADLAESLKKAESLGGSTVMPPVDVPGGPTVAQMRDPEGNLIGLVQQ